MNGHEIPRSTTLVEAALLGRLIVTVCHTVTQ
jgi:hypothetical protein